MDKTLTNNYEFIKLKISFFNFKKWEIFSIQIHVIHCILKGKLLITYLKGTVQSLQVNFISEIAYG